jgi:hypothetical protein
MIGATCYSPLTVSSSILTIYGRITDQDHHDEQDQVPCGTAEGWGLVDGWFFGEIQVQPVLYVVDL